MTIPPESIEVGKCYLMETGHVRRVTRMLPGGRVQFEQRAAHLLPKVWKVDVQDLLDNPAFRAQPDKLCMMARRT